VDSLRLAEELDSEAAKLAKQTDILLEVNAASEASKQGVAVAAATHLAEQIGSLSHLNLRGLMAMAPLTDNEEPIRRAFERVRELFDEMTSQRTGGPNFRELSIGMSNDFEHAIAYGATLVRIGSALFEGLEFARQPDAEVDADPALS
jgi:pyridoxal phosphate enzyme (YggS family)